MEIDRRRVLSTAGAFLTCAVGLSASEAAAHEYAVGKLKVEHPWLRAPLDGETRAQLFMVVYNNSDQPDRLIGVKSAAIGAAELHVAPQFAVTADVIYLPPLKKVTLAPGGSYVQLLDIKKINPVGWGFELTLVFEKAGEVTIDAAIDAPDAQHAHDAEAMERWEKAHGQSSGKGAADETGHDNTKDHSSPGRDNDAAPAPKSE